MIVRGQFHKFLVPGAREVLMDDYKTLPAVYPEIFSIHTSDKAFEEDLVATGLPIAVEKPEGQNIYFDRAYYRGSVKYVNVTYGLGFEITREAIEDNLYRPLNSQGAANLARSMRAAEETSAARVFNLAATTIKAYDGVTLLNTAHPTIGGTLSNTTNADLSTSALKAATERFFALTTDRGIKISITPSILLVPNQNFWIANEILGTIYVKGGSGGETSSIVSESALNVVTQMGLTPIRWAYLTDEDCWFVLAPKDQRKTKFYWRRKPQDVSGTDEEAGIAWFGLTARWSVGATDWRGIDGSMGA